MLEETNTEYAPWNVISGMDKTEAMHEILSIIVENIEARIKSNDGDGIGIRPEDMQHELVDMPKLKDVDLEAKRVSLSIKRTLEAPKEETEE